MTVGFYLIGVTLIALGIAGLVLPVLPGALLLVLGTLAIAAAEGFTRVGWPTVIASLVLAALMTVFDFASSLLGAKVLGSSKWGLAGAGLGFLAGIYFGLPGLLIGPPVGAFVLEYLKEPAFRKAARAGAGVVLGFILGTVGKLALAALMVGLVLLAFIF